MIFPDEGNCVAETLELLFQILVSVDDLGLIDSLYIINLYMHCFDILKVVAWPDHFNITSSGPAKWYRMFSE